MKRFSVIAPVVLIDVVSPAYSNVYTIADLETLGETSSFSAGINARGDVTGTFNTNVAQYPFIYNGTATVSLGNLTGPSSFGTGINSSGMGAFLYNGKTMLGLGVLPGDYEPIGNSVGEAINPSGEVAGTSTFNRGTPHAFLYNWKTIVDLGTPETSNVDLAINNKDGVVGWSVPVGGGPAAAHGTVLEYLSNLLPIFCDMAKPSDQFELLHPRPWVYC